MKRRLAVILIVIALGIIMYHLGLAFGDWLVPDYHVRDVMATVNTSAILWSMRCDGDRIVVRGFEVKCIGNTPMAIPCQTEEP